MNQFPPGMLEEPPDNTISLVARLSQIADAYPPAFQGNPLNLLFLDAVQPVRSAPDYLRSLDRPQLSEDRREYLLGDLSAWPFPAYSIKHRPDPLLLSEKLFERFDSAKEVLVTQRDIARILADKAELHKPDIVVLMVVDGLSYYDLPDEPCIDPCFVDGVTTTEVGYREVIGKPSVSQRLFSAGYRQQMGFTYFDTESNPLASDLYEVFGTSQVHKIRQFDDCIERIRARRMPHGYVQVAAPGLDSLCHKHQDEPPVQHYIDQILSRFDALVDCLRGHSKRVLACLTADHGILWRQSLEGSWSIAGDLHPDDARRHVRYIKGSRARHYVCVRNCLGDAYSMLKVPYTTRELRSNEWGVHGGISAWESLVPLIIRET